MSETPPDPMAMFRTWLGQWEQAANQMGGEFLQRPETAAAIGGATAAGAQIQAAMQETSARAFAAANLPSRADIEALGARLGAVEAALARIEARLTPANAPKDGPPRTRKAHPRS